MARLHHYQTTRWIVLPKGQVLARVVARGPDYTEQEALVQRACIVHKPDGATVTAPVGVCCPGACEESLVYESGSFHLRLR